MLTRPGCETQGCADQAGCENLGLDKKLLDCRIYCVTQEARGDGVKMKGDMTGADMLPYSLMLVLELF